MPVQTASWTCSACSLSWVLRATSLDKESTEWSAVYQIGTPENINSTYGLMDSSGSQLRSVLRGYGANSEQAWLTFDSVYALADNYPIIMSGGSWYHWVGVRGKGDTSLWIANSAPGYRGVWDNLTRSQFNELGPFSVVWITH